MASFQKSQSIDILNVRKIYAKGDNNNTLPANSVLVTDGLGGTSWINLSVINQGTSFNRVVTTQSTFTSGAGTTTLSILDGSNVGLLPTNSTNTVKMYAKAFGQIDVPGSDSIYSFDTVTGTIHSNVTMVGSGIINISTDTSRNLINFYSPNDATSTMSTAITKLSTLNTAFSSIIHNFTSPFSTFIYNAISSFSTAIGPTVTTVTFPAVLSTVTSSQFYSANLNTSSINLMGNRQPSIQYGNSITNLGGSNIITISPYINSNFAISLTYKDKSTPPVIPLYTSSITTSNFIVLGDPSSKFHWTTYGNYY